MKIETVTERGPCPFCSFKFLIFNFLIVLFFSCPVSLHADVEESFPTTLVHPAFRHTWGIFRVTESLIGLFLGDRGRIDDPQGIAVVRLKETDDPASDADDDEVTVFGVNSGAGDLLYNPSMSGAAAFGGTEDPRCGLLRPGGVAADEDGNVFIADSGHGRVVHLRLRGGKMGWAGEFGPGTLTRPSGVALDRGGRVYVTDPVRDRVFITSYEGRPVRPPLEIPSPTGIAVADSTDRWSYFREYGIYVICADSAEIRRINAGGQVAASVRASDLPGPSPARFSCLALDYCNNLYATDPSRHAIHKFDRNLAYLTTFGQRGAGDAQFFSPRGIAIHRRFGQVFIVEQHGARYYWVGVDLRSLDTRFDPARGEVAVDLFPTERAFVNMEVFRKGRPVRNLASRWAAEPGRNRVTWDLKDGGGRRVEAGTYEIRVRVEPTYSSFTHFRKTFERTVEIR